MTAGGLVFNRVNLEAGDTISINISKAPYGDAYYPFGDTIYWRITDDSDINMVKGKKSGVLEFSKDGSTPLNIRTRKKPAGGSARIGVQISTDKTFSNASWSFTDGGQPSYFTIYTKYDKDSITGSWRAGYDPKYDGNLRDILILQAESGRSKHDRYFFTMNYRNTEQTSFGGIVKIGAIYGDTDNDYDLDKEDKLITKLKNINYYYHPGPSSNEGPWRIDKKEGVLTLWRGGNRTFEASVDASLF